MERCPSQAAPANKKATAFAAMVGWLLSLAAARGGVTIDPDLVLRLDRDTLMRAFERVVVSLSRPIVSGAAALLEVLSRLVLLLLALVLCAAPNHREAVLQRVRGVLREHVEVAVRLSLRMSPTPRPPPPLAALPAGALPNILVVGAPGVGKSTLISALRSSAKDHGLELAAAEGLPTGRALEAYAKVRLGIVVWEAALDQPLGAYVQRYAEQMQAVVGNPSLNVVVVCNKTDLTPCPIPQLSELRESQPFIAVSAERGTNLRHFWGMVQPTLSKPPSRTASTAGPADETSTAASTQGGLAERRLDSLGLLRR
jgi:hypothetical protein